MVMKKRNPEDRIQETEEKFLFKFSFAKKIAVSVLYSAYRLRNDACIGRPRRATKHVY